MYTRRQDEKSRARAQRWHARDPKMSHGHNMLPRGPQATDDTSRRAQDGATPTRPRHGFWTVSGRLADDETHEQRVTPRRPDGNKMDPSAPKVAPE